MVDYGNKFPPNAIDGLELLSERKLDRKTCITGEQCVFQRFWESHQSVVYQSNPQQYLLTQVLRCNNRRCNSRCVRIYNVGTTQLDQDDAWKSWNETGRRIDY